MKREAERFFFAIGRNLYGWIFGVRAMMGMKHSIGPYFITMLPTYQNTKRKITDSVKASVLQIENKLAAPILESLTLLFVIVKSKWFIMLPAKVRTNIM